MQHSIGSAPLGLDVTRSAHCAKWVGYTKSLVDDEAVLHVFRPQDAALSAEAIINASKMAYP
jgi:hypothetical protein